MGVGLGVGDAAAVGEAAGVGETVPVAVPVGVRVGVPVGAEVAVAVLLGVAVGLGEMGVVARAAGVTVAGGRAASWPPSSGRPGGRIRSQRARMEATRRASKEPRNTMLDGIAVAGS